MLTPNCIIKPVYVSVRNKYIHICQHIEVYIHMYIYVHYSSSFSVFIHNFRDMFPFVCVLASNCQTNVKVPIRRHRICDTDRLSTMGPYYGPLNWNP